MQFIYLEQFYWKKKSIRFSKTVKFNWTVCGAFQLILKCTTKLFVSTAVYICCAFACVCVCQFSHHCVSAVFSNCSSLTAAPLYLWRDYFILMMRSSAFCVKSVRRWLSVLVFVLWHGCGCGTRFAAPASRKQEEGMPGWNTPSTLLCVGFFYFNCVYCVCKRECISVF